jgi:malonyl-CoA decarboxylase
MKEDSNTKNSNNLRPPRSVNPHARLPPGRPSLRRAGRLIQLCHALISQRGEASGYELACKVSAGYLALDEQEQADFFYRLANEFSPRPETVSAAWEVYRENPSPANLVRLQDIVEPPRQELFRRMNIARQGMRTIVEMRRHLFRHLSANPQLAGIEADLIHLLRSWFNRGFLEMRRIDWRTSALVLEKLIEHEAVHEIQGWLPRLAGFATPVAGRPTLLRLLSSRAAR